MIETETLHASLVRASVVHHPAQILIDATQLVSTDSAGLAVLAEAAAHVRGTGGRLIVVGARLHRPALAEPADMRATIGVALADLRTPNDSPDQR